MENLNAENERVLLEAKQERDGSFKRSQRNQKYYYKRSKEKANEEAERIMSSARTDCKRKNEGYY